MTMMDKRNLSAFVFRVEKDLPETIAGQVFPLRYFECHKDFRDFTFLTWDGSPRDLFGDELVVCMTRTDPPESTLFLPPEMWWLDDYARAYVFLFLLGAKKLHPKPLYRHSALKWPVAPLADKRDIMTLLRDRGLVA